MNKWELEDIEELARADPERFFVPSLQERKSQTVGDRVRLHFLLSKNEPGLVMLEKVWVEITQVSANGELYGCLTEQPRHSMGLVMGDKIRFRIANIAQVLHPEREQFFIDYGDQFVIISKNCLETEGQVRFIYRERPEQEEDSGWRIFSGEESDEEASDLQNFKEVNLAHLINRDPTLSDVIRGGKYGDVYERMERDSAWQKVGTWKPGE
jgi:hypothetical protein